MTYRPLDSLYYKLYLSFSFNIHIATNKTIPEACLLKISEMPLNLRKKIGKPFKKLFHRHCVKKPIASVDEEDTVDERTIEKVRRKLTCKKVEYYNDNLF